jgi:hypothetical protein
VTRDEDDVSEFGLGGRPAEVSVAGDEPVPETDPTLPFFNKLRQKLGLRVPLPNTAKQRRWNIGLGPATVPPNSSVTVRVQPRVKYQGEKLINTGDGAGLEIENFFVGQYLQSLPSRRVEDYAGNSISGFDHIKMDVCDAAIMFAFQIKNNTAATLTWSMAIIGRTV